MSDELVVKPKTNSVKKIEDRLNYLVEFDIKNPQIYELLKQLASIFIYQNKYMYGYHDIQEVCHDVASDLYMKVLKGTRVKAWIYYIGTCIKRSYVPNQRKVEHEIIDTSGNPALKNAVTNMCTSATQSIISDMDHLQRSLFLDNIDNLIRVTLSHTKFKSTSLEWLSLYTNVSLNLYRIITTTQKTFEYSYLRLENHLKPYVKIIINQFYKEFLCSEFMQSIMDTVSEDLAMTVFGDEGSMKEYYERWQN